MEMKMYPTSLSQWFAANVPSDNMLYRGGWLQQRDFFSLLAQRFADGLNEPATNVASVISAHTSKSILLPVVRMDRHGLAIVMRNNFYDWKLSVSSIRDVDVGDILPKLTRSAYAPVDRDYTGDDLSPCYFEGFPADWIYGPYMLSNTRTWSASIYGDYDLWTLVTTILLRLGMLPTVEYSRRE